MKYVLYIFPFLFIVLYVVFVPVRLVLQHPILFFKYLFLDTYLFFKYRKWNNFPSGSFTCFDSKFGVVFGSGKTLSVVEVEIYNDNNDMVAKSTMTFYYINK